MTKIKTTEAYTIKRPLALTDYAVGTNSENLGPGMAKGQTISMQLSDIRNVVVEGLSPEIGGTLKITEIEYEGELTSPADVANQLNPVYIVSQYEVLIFNVNGNKYLLKLQDVTIGDGEPNVSNSDFITVVAVKNLGDGTAVMFGYNSDGEIQFRSIKSTGNDVSVSGGNVVIDPKAGTSVGDAGVDVYKGLNATTKLHEIRKAKSVGLDITIDGDSVKYESKAGANVGASGTGVYKGLNSTTKIHEFFKLNFPDFNVSVANDIITVTLPEDPSDVKFYVNANYTGEESNGSLGKPYKSLREAFTAYQGSGTVLDPEFKNIGTIELLSDVVIPNSGASTMTYLSINQLRLNGNGYTIYYRSTQDYFISTKYLVDLDPKSASQTLDNNIYMYFKNVNVISETTHKIVYHLNYKSPIVSGFQNSSGISFENCKIIDRAYLSELPSYSNSGQILFGLNVFVQNTLSTNNYVVVNENVNWYNEGEFKLRNSRIEGCSSTLFYNLNSSVSWFNVEMDFSSYYVAYQTLSSSIYSTRNNLYYIKNENNVDTEISNGFVRIQNFNQTFQKKSSGGKIIGGANCFCRLIGASLFTLETGFFYSDKMNNLIQIENTTGECVLNGLITTYVDIEDATYGSLKYTGTLPGSPKFITANNSTLYFVKNWSSNQYIRVTSPNSIVNGTYFNTLSGYADNSAAIAGGLVPGNVYFNTSTNVATRVV